MDNKITRDTRNNRRKVTALDTSIVNDDVTNFRPSTSPSSSWTSLPDDFTPYTDECYFFKEQTLTESFFTSLNQLKLLDKLIDVKIFVSGVEIHGHRVILASTIPYFEDMFTNDFTVDESVSHVHIKGDNLNGDAFKLLVDFVYTGTIEITNDNVLSIFIASSFLGLKNVTNCCANFIKKKLQVDNVINYKQFAEIHNCQSLVNCAQVYIERHFESICTKDDFLNLPLESIRYIISSDELNVKSEKSVFQALMRWINCDKEKRKEYLPSLLRHIRLTVLSPQYLADVVSNETLIKESLECRDLLDEARNYLLMPERNWSLTLSSCQPRNAISYGIIYAVGGLVKNGDSMSAVESFDPNDGFWVVSKTKSTPRTRVGVAVMNCKMYVIGGYNGHERLSTVEVFDPSTRRWDKISSINCKRSAVGTCSLDEKNLFVCGGYDGIRSLNTVEKYDPIIDEWSLIAPMAKARSAAGVTAYKGSIFVIGGHDGLSIFNSVEKYNTLTSEWETMVPMLTQRCRLGVAVLKDKIYVCGGYDGSSFLQTAEVFDPETEKWSFISPMICMRSRVSLVSTYGKLYAIGGYDGNNNLKSVEVYDPEKDEWQLIPSMIYHEGGVGAAVIPTY